MGFEGGAPGGITALAQTTDGYLWIGTTNGLFRFDGIRFASFTSVSGAALPRTSILSLHAFLDGGLCIGYLGGGASLLKKGTLTNFGEKQGLRPGPLWAFASDRQGRIWAAANTGGLLRLEGSRCQAINSLNARLISLFVDLRGTLWGAGPSKIMYMPEGEDKFHLLSQRSRALTSLAESAEGTMWMSDFGYAIISLVPAPDGGNAPETRKSALLW